VLLQVMVFIARIIEKIPKKKILKNASDVRAADSQQEKKNAKNVLDLIIHSIVSCIKIKVIKVPLSNSSNQNILKRISVLLRQIRGSKESRMKI
jgi:hypothetical protein